MRYLLQQFGDEHVTQGVDAYAQPYFIDADEACRIDIELAVEPVLATLQKIGALLLQCMCGLFLNVQPRLRSQTSSALRPMETALYSCNRRAISLRVMSFASSIMPTMMSSWASKARANASALFPKRQPTSRRTRNPGDGC